MAGSPDCAAGKAGLRIRLRIRIRVRLRIRLRGGLRTAAGWAFEAAGLEDCPAADWAHGKPVLDTEFGYQYEPGYESEKSWTTRQVHQPATVRRKAWKIATAGGYFAAGFEGTAVRNFTTADVDNFRPSQLETLQDFFTRRTEYWTMSSHLELVASHNVLLALPGKEYVAYFPRGGAIASCSSRGSTKWNGCTARPVGTSDGPT